MSDNKVRFEELKQLIDSHNNSKKIISNEQSSTINRIKDTMKALGELNFMKDGSLYNIVSSISDRNVQAINILEVCLQSGEAVFSYYAIRDIIENIEVISYMMIENGLRFGDNNEDELETKYVKIFDKIYGKYKLGKFEFRNKKEELLRSKLNKYYDVSKLNDEYDKILKLKVKCNNIIHKNTIKHINFVINSKSIIEEQINGLLLVCKFYLKLIFCLMAQLFHRLTMWTIWI